MPLDIYNYIAYYYNVNKLIESTVFKSYSIELSTFGLMYMVMSLSSSFFEADEITQQRHIADELGPLFSFLRIQGLPESILNYNQRRLTTKVDGVEYYVDSLLIYFTFKTYYIKVWKIITLCILTAIYFLIF